MNKYKHIVLILISVLGFSCTRIPNNKDECSQYFDFINENWILVDKTKILYHFRDKPDFGNWDMNGESYNERRARYFQRNCLIGLTTKQIIRIYGKPSKKVSFSEKEYVGYLFYCMDEKCLKLNPFGGRTYFVFEFNKNGQVSQVHLAPLGFEKSH